MVKREAVDGQTDRHGVAESCATGSQRSHEQPRATAGSFSRDRQDDPEHFSSISPGNTSDGAAYISPKHNFVGNGTWHGTVNANRIKPVTSVSSSGTSSQHPLRQGVTQPVHVNHVTGIDHQLANANRKNQAAEKVKSLGSASGTGLRPGSTSVTTHNPKVNLSDRPHTSVNPHQTASIKDVLSQKPVGYSGWSKQTVSHGSMTNPSHQTASKLPTIHTGTSTTHTSQSTAGQEAQDRRCSFGKDREWVEAIGCHPLTATHGPSERINNPAPQVPVNQFQEHRPALGDSQG